MSRRPPLAAMVAMLSLLVAAPALAQDWPQPGKTIQLIVPAPGGSGTGDTIARVLAEEHREDGGEGEALGHRCTWG